MSSLHTPLIFRVCVCVWGGWVGVCEASGWGGGAREGTLFLSHPVDAKTLLLVFTVNYNSDWLTVLPGSTILLDCLTQKPITPPPPAPPPPPHPHTHTHTPLPPASPLQSCSCLCLSSGKVQLTQVMFVSQHGST